MPRSAAMVSPLTPVPDQVRAHNERHQHPYRRLHGRLAELVRPATTVLDIGCGRTAPTLRGFAGRAARLYGIDLVPFEIDDPAITLRQADVTNMPFLPSAHVDLAYSRSVMEHVDDPAGALREIYRVLKPGGRYVCLTPNKWDYASLAARAVPNRLHPRLVTATSGRAPEDVFPTRYKFNCRTDIERLSRASGFDLVRFTFHGQYPAYLQFSRPAFWLGCQYERLLDAWKPLKRFQGWIFCELVKPETPPQENHIP